MTVARAGCWLGLFTSFLLLRETTWLPHMIVSQPQQGKSGTARLPEAYVPCTSSLLQSISQTRSQSQPRFKAQKNRLHFLMGGEAMSRGKATHIQGCGSYCSHLYKPSATLPMLQCPHSGVPGMPQSRFFWSILLQLLFSVVCQGGEGTAVLLQEVGERIWSPNYIWIRLPTSACVFNPCSSVFRVSCKFHFLIFLGFFWANIHASWFPAPWA